MSGVSKANGKRRDVGGYARARPRERNVWFCGEEGLGRNANQRKRKIRWGLCSGGDLTGGVERR